MLEQTDPVIVPTEAPVTHPKFEPVSGGPPAETVVTDPAPPSETSTVTPTPVVTPTPRTTFEPVPGPGTD